MRAFLMFEVVYLIIIIMSDKPWFVNVKGNAMIDMSNLEYLENLLKISRTIVSPGNQKDMKFLIWDL